MLVYLYFREQLIDFSVNFLVPSIIKMSKPSNFRNDSEADGSFFFV